MTDTGQRITIVGGGSAGWLAALALNTRYPEKQITVIASEEIGILGAGEGTTPFFTKFLSQLNIPAMDIIKYCSGTVKLGIEFKHWRADAKNYFHSFEDLDGLYYTDKTSSTYSCFTYELAQNKQVPVVLRGDVPCSVSPWALHFDANLLAKYLKETALSRGVKYVDARVTKLELSTRGEIVGVQLTSGDVLDTTFLVDCSGFARLGLGGTYKDLWVSYKKRLPVDTAIPFFIPHDNNVTPVTEAIAMKYGWVWKIPVRDRYGCGYVFDSTQIDKEKALAEAEEYFGVPLNSPKEFKFYPGRYTNTLVKNCLAVGLSQSFIEPLEATSLWTTCTVLDCFLQHDGINNWRDRKVSSEVNRVYADIMDNIVDFVHLHYFTTRKDTEFWRNFAQNHPMTAEQKRALLEIKSGKETMISPNSLFTRGSWLSVACGIELVDFKNKPSALKETKPCLTHKDLVAFCGER